MPRTFTAVPLLALTSLTVTGCFPLVPGGTTMLLKTKEPPTKIAVTDFVPPFYAGPTTLAWWSEEPVWGKTTHARRADGQWEISRNSTNLPLVYVWIDATITGGADCRWASMQLKQVQVASGARDYDVTTDETFINRDFVDHQFTWDCAKIKAVVANDPRYKAAMDKE